MKNKVLFVLRFPPPFGGGEIVSQELYSQTKNNSNYEFLLIKYKNHSKAKQNRENISAVYRGLTFIVKTTWALIKYCPKSIYLGLPKTFGSFIRTSIVILFARLLGVIVIGEIHGMRFHFLTNKIKIKYYKYIINKVSKIRVLGSSIKENIKQTGYKNKIFVISNGVSIPRISFQDYYPSKIKFLYFGAISRSKGFFRLLNVLKKLYENGIDNWSLDVVGEWVKHEEERRWEEMKNSIPYKQLNFTFHGKLTGNDKWKVVSKCNYLMHFTENDGQPLTIIETLGLGIPSITTKVGAIPEMIINETNGFLVDNDEHAYLVTKTICENKVNYEDIKSACIDTYKKKYTPEVMTALIEKMIND